MTKLSASGKTVKRVLPDGNCFFRSLSFCLHGSEKQHSITRADIVAHINANRGKYEPILFSGSIEDHVERMVKSCVWATQVEIQAAADYYNRDIYVLTETPEKDDYHWLLYTSKSLGKKATGHIQLAHLASIHFDPVIDVQTQGLPQSPPLLKCHEEVVEL